MPLDAVGDVAGGLLRFIVRVVWELLFETLIQGTGRVVMRVLGQPDASDTACAVAGLIAWALVALAAVLLLG